MNKKDWKKYQVNTDKGIKLVDELTIHEAKTELCVAIEIIEQLSELNRKALELLK